MGIYQGSKLMSGGGGGPSPYEIANQNGYIGTESEFNQLLAALDQNVTEQELNNKADLVNGKVPAEQVDAYTKTEADTLLQNKANTADFQSHTTSKSNPHGVTATQTGAYTKGETDTLLQNKADKDRVVNPNLLDNWYFGNPVNQRGQTSYTGAGYGIDRWFLETAPSTKFVIELHEGFIRLVQESVTETDRWQAIYQSIGDTAKSIAGKVITVSLLHRGTGKTQLYLTKQNTSNAFAKQVLTNTTNWQVSTLTATIPDDATEVRLRIYADVTGSLGYTDVKAVKLELGGQQTLAHQENGVWVLNEIPDYGEQLARCQRYFIRIGVPAAQENGAIGFANCANTTLANSHMSTPVPMRAIPTATLKNIVLRKGITDFSVTGCNVFAITGNGIYMNFVSSGLTAGDTLLIRTVTGGYIDFTADL